MRPTPAAPTSLLPACLVALAVLLAGTCAPAWAWGKPAHRLVAGLAEAPLRPAARAEAARLLATEGAAHLSEVSDWADEVREAGGARARDTRRWHFVNFDSAGCEYAPARDCPDGDCIVAAINHQFGRLADRRLPDGERTEALKFLVHLVADVHQPLHATPKSLRGGLNVQVQARGKGGNLHALWDATLLERARDASSLDERGYLRHLQAQSPLPADPTRASDRRVAEWAQESCRVIDADALRPAGRVLADADLDARRARLDLQLRLAGARLADMLNSALDPAEPAASR